MAEANGFVEPHLIHQAAKEIEIGQVKIFRYLAKHCQFEYCHICTIIRDQFMMQFDHRTLKDLLGYYQEQKLPQPDVTQFGQFLWTPGADSELVHGPQ
ncbi:MAG: hypothetical protein Q9176_004196 [Flavoplaca citrina]